MNAMEVDTTAQMVTMNKNLGSQYSHHLQQLTTIIHGIKQHIQHMCENRAKHITDEHNSLSFHIITLLSEMKSMNRILNHTMDQIRTSVQVEKSSFDRVSLDLQSLLYEKQHLQKQIHTQQYFKSKQKPVEMIPLEEFMALPSTQAQLSSRATPATQHDIHLLRLQHELAERKNLVTRVEELSLRKRSLTDLNDKRRSQLRSLYNKLQSIYVDTLPIQILLNMGNIEMIPITEYVGLLPSPLYTLYQCAICYQRAFDPDNLFSITIDGDVTRAREFNESLPTSSTTNMTTSPLDLSSLTTTYPLDIIMELRINQVTVLLRIKWMNVLKVVTVLVEIKGGAPATAASSPTPSLVHLYSDDAGTEWPNDLAVVLSPAGAAEFHRRFKLDPITYGTPYRWLQSLCGLHYPHPRHTIYPYSIGLADIIKRIISRVHIKQQLHTQISGLVKRTYPFPDPSDDHPLKTRAQLIKFTRTQRTEWDTLNLKQYGNDSDIEIGADYYGIQFKRDDAILNGVIRITPEYPLRPPTFVLAYGHAPPALVANKVVKQSSDSEALALAQSAGARAAVTDNNIKEMEMLVNTHFSLPLTQIAQLESHGEYHLLSYQLRSLHMMFDLIWESDHGSMGLRDRFYERAVRGRDRRRPFLYDPSTHSFDQSSLA